MERIELSDESQEDYLEYKIIHDDGSEGSASLTIRDLYDGSPHFMAYQLRNETLPDNAKVAELFLYPHSETSSKRTGVASRVLDHILKDAAERKIKVVFCEITNLDIRNFCQAKGFKGNYEPHCYVVV